MASTAPGSVKLFGEHAVIYGRTGVSAAFGKHATVRITTPASRTVAFSLPDFNFSCTLTEEEFSGKFIATSEALKSGDLKRLDALRTGDFALPFVHLIGSALLRKGFRPSPSPRARTNCSPGTYVPGGNRPASAAQPTDSGGIEIIINETCLNTSRYS